MNRKQITQKFKESFHLNFRNENKIKCKTQNKTLGCLWEPRVQIPTLCLPSPRGVPSPAGRQTASSGHWSPPARGRGGSRAAPAWGRCRWGKPRTGGARAVACSRRTGGPQGAVHNEKKIFTNYLPIIYQLLNNYKKQKQSHFEFLSQCH